MLRGILFCLITIEYDISEAMKLIKKAIYIITAFAILYLVPNSLHKRNEYNASYDLTNAHSFTATVTLTPTITPEPDRISLSFVGDILLAGNIENKIKTYGEDSIFKNVREFLSSRDIVIGNLESSVSGRGIPEKDKTYTFRAKPETIKLLKDTGFDAMSLANNHILDYGVDSLYDTMTNLDKYNILHGGAGKNKNEAYKPLIIRVNNKKVAVLFYSYVIPSGAWSAGDKTPGVASAYNHTDLLKAIGKIRKNVDVVTVYIHWGKEKAIVPENYERNLAHSAIDIGADLIIGTHSHTLQGFEVYKDKLIAYSLGNFVFSSTAKSTIILNVDINKDKFIYHYTPCLSENYTPMIITDSIIKSKMDNALQERSYNVKIVDNVIKSNQK